MSHATAIVVIDGDTPMHDIESMVQATIEPYYEYLDQGDGEGYNHDNAKWDWWVIGGRWSNSVINTTHTIHHDPNPNIPIDPIFNDHWDEHVGGVNIVRKRDLKNIQLTLAFVNKEGWFERGELGWFGHVAEKTDPDLWDSAFHQLLDKVDDNDWLVLIDYHI